MFCVRCSTLTPFLHSAFYILPSSFPSSPRLGLRQLSGAFPHVLNQKCYPCSDQACFSLFFFAPANERQAGACPPTSASICSSAVSSLSLRPGASAPWTAPAPWRFSLPVPTQPRKRPSRRTPSRSLPVNIWVHLGPSVVRPAPKRLTGNPAGSSSRCRSADWFLAASLLRNGPRLAGERGGWPYLWQKSR